MAKYMVLYSATMSASELMANATPEQMKASIEEWKQWRDEANKKATIDFGLPLQAIGKITPAGQSDSESKVAGYSIAEADSKDIVMEVFANHPNLKREGSAIDILEMLPMPGIVQQ